MSTSFVQDFKVFWRRHLEILLILLGIFHGLWIVLDLHHFSLSMVISLFNPTSIQLRTPTYVAVWNNNLHIHFNCRHPTDCNSVGTMKRTGSVGVRTYCATHQNPSIGLVNAGGLVYGYVVWFYVSSALCVRAPLCIYPYILTKERYHSILVCAM